MIITNLLKKIKLIIEQNEENLVYIIIIIFVAISSFFIGRLSVEAPKGDNNEIDRKMVISKDDNYNNLILKNKNYVASKNGKIFYPVNCNLANRIKEENKIWFETREDALKSGFTVSSSCN